MAGSSRRFALAAVAFPFLFLVMVGSALAVPPNVIVVTTTFGGSVIGPGPCSLTDAVAAANAGGTVNNCVGAAGPNEIEFGVTGRITLDATLDITAANLTIEGPPIGGITISGDNAHEIIDAESSSTLILQNLTFEDGSAAEGGAIFANGTLLQILDCLFVDNAASSKGGAIYINSTGKVDITNSTFTGNTSVNVGGAIANMGPSPALKITNSTIADNSASAGGGYASMVAPLVKATIFNANSPKNCATVHVNDKGFNISSDASCGTSHDSTNPTLDPAGLANNGGPTETIALESSSPARGLDTDCTDQESPTPQPVSTDQRLYGRPNSPSFCDSGAYEFDAVAPIVLDTTGERLQIARSSAYDSDQINMAFTFTDNGLGNPLSCDEGNNAFNGILVELIQGACTHLYNNGLPLLLDPWVTHTVNHQTYGTFFESEPPATVSARMVGLPTPASACGEWTLNLEVAGIDTAKFGLTGGGGPGQTYALILEDADFNLECFDITNAIVGNQIDPPSKTVRR